MEKARRPKGNAHHPTGTCPLPPGSASTRTDPETPRQDCPTAGQFVGAVFPGIQASNGGCPREAACKSCSYPDTLVPSAGYENTKLDVVVPRLPLLLDDLYRRGSYHNWRKADRTRSRLLGLPCLPLGASASSHIAPPKPWNRLLYYPLFYDTTRTPVNRCDPRDPNRSRFLAAMVARTIANIPTLPSPGKPYTKLSPSPHPHSLSSPAFRSVRRFPRTWASTGLQGSCPMYRRHASLRIHIGQ